MNTATPVCARVMPRNPRGRLRSAFHGFDLCLSRSSIAATLVKVIQMARAMPVLTISVEGASGMRFSMVATSTTMAAAVMSSRPATMMTVTGAGSGNRRK